VLLDNFVKNIQAILIFTYINFYDHFL
jgi:hypothetical protein